MTRWLLFLTLLSLGCVELPRDPKRTSERVRGGTMRVGLVEQHPWVVRTPDGPAGAEVELVKRFAAELNATPEWVWGGTQQHMEALERFELDLVVGGITNDNPWKKRVGVAGPYFEDHLRVGDREQAPGDDIDGKKVRVKSGDVAAAYLKKEGAVPVPVADLASGEGPAAAADWQLEALGLRVGGPKLQKRQFIVAAPPGENGWIKKVEAFFVGREGEVRDLLKKEAATR